MPNKATDDSTAAPSPRNSSQQRRGIWALWIGVIIMFLLVIIAWTTLIKIVNKNPVERIEVEQTSGS